MFTNVDERGVPTTDRAGFPIRRRAVDIRPHDHSADSLETQRDRRRRGLTVVYDERLSLSAEVAAALSGIPAQITADPSPARWAGRVRDAGHAIAETLAAVAREIHRSAPDVPESGPDSVLSGAWAVALVDAARTLDEALSGELARPNRVVAGDPIGVWLVDRLRDIDREARALRTALTAAHTTDRPEPPSDEGRAFNALRDRHSAELAELRERHRAELAAFADARQARKIGGNTKEVSR
ncbi:hypothetical protein ACWDO0_16335 [Nocardia rhamnosiphila]